MPIISSRPLGSRVGAHASLQSQPLESREVLQDRVTALTESLGEAPPRPAHWGGYRITPYEMEFWADGEFRLHDRFRWVQSAADDSWDIQRLYP